MQARSRLYPLVVAMLALPAAALAAGSLNGTYKGKTSQKRSISISVKDHAITALHAKVKNSCHAGHKPIDVTGGRTKIKADGTFSMSLANSTGSLKVSGRFSGSKATGMLREKAEDALFGGTCDTGKVRFTVSR